jgi:hypothetical protein
MITGILTSQLLYPREMDPDVLCIGGHWSSGDGNLSLWGLSWATWGGLIYWDFEIWLKGALGMECFSPWGSVKGTWREGSLSGDTEGEKALEKGTSGEPGGGLVYRGL